MTTEASASAAFSPHPLATEKAGEKVAFILHSRAYKENSALLDLFSKDGLCRAVLHRARSAFGALAQPFIALDIELSGRSELKTVSRLEAVAAPLPLSGERLFSALYLNELLMRLLPPADAHPALFAHYQHSLAALAADEPLEPVLRHFEWQLLSELGYGFALDREQNGEPLCADRHYRLQSEGGLRRSETPEGGFSGQCLLALARGDWNAGGALVTAKRLMRMALAAHLGNKPLISRELFIRPKVAAHA